MVSCLIVWSLNHFEFIFVYGVSTSYCRDCLFTIAYSCLLCHRLFDYKCVGLFLGPLFCSLIYISLFVPVPHVLIPVAVQYCLNSGRVMPLALLFFLRIGDSGSFVIPYKF